MENAKAGRLLLCDTVCVALAHLSSGFERERADEDRSVLLRVCTLRLEECDVEQGVSSEMTRAFENPHIRLGVVLIVEPRCERRHCSDCAGVQRPGWACCGLGR